MTDAKLWNKAARMWAKEAMKNSDSVPFPEGRVIRINNDYRLVVLECDRRHSLLALYLEGPDGLDKMWE